MGKKANQILTQKKVVFILTILTISLIILTLRGGVNYNINNNNSVAFHISKKEKDYQEAIKEYRIREKINIEIEQKLKLNRSIANAAYLGEKVITNAAEIETELKRIDLSKTHLIQYVTTLYGDVAGKKILKCHGKNGEFEWVVSFPVYEGQKSLAEIYLDTNRDMNSIVEKYQSSDYSAVRVLHATEPPNLRYCTNGRRTDCYPYFNWTASYTSDSEIWFHGYDKPPNSLYEQYYEHTIDSIMETKNKFKLEYQAKKANGTLLPHQLSHLPLASWFCANCDDHHSNRKLIAMALMDRGVPIDSYGPCLNNIDGGPELGRYRGDFMTQKLAAMSKYKFYLAFENGNCPDYNTEKGRHALAVGSVPIYLGNKEAARFYPKGSYIFVNDFDSVQELADYLIYLDENDAEYIKYHSWRSDQKVIKHWKEINGYPKRTFEYTLFCPILRKYQSWVAGEIKSTNVVAPLESCLPRNHYNLTF